MQQKREDRIMKGSICHVEIPADNVGALQGFYSNLFEWDFEKITGDMEYYNVKHGEEKPMGGMMARMSPDQKPTFYVCVDSSEEAIRKTMETGGSIIVPRTPVKGMGWYAVLMDPQSNPFGVWESDEKAA
jgi:uncharacterized protein